MRPARAAMVVVVTLLVSGASLNGSGATLPDFVSDPTANLAAALVSQDLESGFASDPNFVGERITASGLEISLSAQPSAAQRTLVDSAVTRESTTLRAGGVEPAANYVPITFRVVPNSLASLNDLTDRLTRDAPGWSAGGAAFSSWGPDVNSDLVVLRLQNYSRTAAAALQAAYGPLLQVSPESEEAIGSSR